MAGVELSLFGSEAAKDFHELAHLIVLEDIVGPVAVSDENRAIGCDCDGTGFKCVGVFIDVGCRFLWKTNGPLTLAVEGELDDLMIDVPGGVDVFGSIFLA